MNAAPTDVSQEQIARRAYEIWESRGCPPGDGSSEWQAAEAELVAARTQRNGSTATRVKTFLGRVRQKIAGGAT